MELDSRSIQILQSILSSRCRSSRELLAEHDLTRNQLDYTLKKINSYLLDQGYDSIVRSKKGLFIISPSLQDKLGLFVTDDEHSFFEDHYVLDEKYRGLVILLLIFSEDYLSLYHFSDTFKVSKNTINTDIKKLKNSLTTYNITITYTRKKGYHFLGNEEVIRELIISVIDEIVASLYTKMIFTDYLTIDQPTIESKRDFLREIEQVLNISFTDNRIKNAPYFLVLLNRRINNAHCLNEEFNHSIKEVKETKEYEIISQILAKYKAFPNILNEQLYICLFILSLKVTDIGSTISLNTDVLRKQVAKFIATLEQNTAIQLNEKDQLIENLSLHLAPAYYRIRYRLTSDLSINDVIKDQLEPLFFMVKLASDPLEEFFKTTIPDHEIYLITMFIGAYLQKDKPINEKNSTVNAVVVCPNGIISSKLLENTLANWFPMIHFTDSLSIREFYSQEDQITAHLIFSTEPLNTNRHVVVVGNDLADMNKASIVNDVVRLVYKIDSYKLQPDNILAIVRKYLEIPIEVEKNIKNELQIAYNSIFQIQDQTVLNNNQQLHLADIITKDSLIFIDEEVPDWTLILETATTNLIERGIVEPCYLTHLKEQYPAVVPGIILGEQIVIPHTAPENGAKQLGMCFAKLKHHFLSNGRRYHYVVVVSAVDRQTHIKPMMELLKLATTPTLMEKMDTAQTSEEVLAVLEQLKD